MAKWNAMRKYRVKTNNKEKKISNSWPRANHDIMCPGVSEEERVSKDNDIFEEIIFEK